MRTSSKWGPSVTTTNQMRFTEAGCTMAVARCGDKPPMWSCTRSERTMPFKTNAATQVATGASLVQAAKTKKAIG